MAQNTGIMGGIYGFNTGMRPTGFDFSVLNGYYLAKAGVGAQAKVSAPAKPPPVSVQYAPWLQKSPLNTDAARLRDALQTTRFVDLNDSNINKPGVDGDHKKLFAVYKGLTKLQALAERATAEKVPTGERTSLDKRFRAGLDELRTFLTEKDFDSLSLLLGEKVSKVDTGYRKVRPSTTYTAPVIVTGTSTDAIQGLTGTEVFSVTVAKGSNVQSVTMDLSEIQAPVSVDSLIAYMNGKLETIGAYTRFGKSVQPGKTPSDPSRIGLTMQTVVSERISLSAQDTQAALYVGSVGSSGSDKFGQLTKLTDGATAPGSNFSKKITATGGTVDVRGSATDSDGNVFVVGSTTEDVGGAIVQGEQDVYLRKYDSAGALVWSRLLGSSKTAAGFSVAVDGSGNVAVAGRVTDKLTTTSAGGGGDSFVAKYDTAGREVFLRQVSPVADDRATAVAFATDGSLVVAGQTASAMAASATHAGATDAYLMKLSATGAMEWVRQFGGATDDRATGLAMTADGHAVLTSMEDGRAIVRKIALADGISAPAWSVDLGTVGNGSLASVAVDGNSIYVAGSTDVTDLGVAAGGTIATAHSGGMDGFVTRLDDAGTSASVSFTSYVGTANQDSGMSLVAGNGAVYVAGSTGGLMGANAGTGVSDAYVRKLDSSGATVWTHQMTNVSGLGAANALALDVTGSSVLDRLGLPRGRVSFDETTMITAGSSVRAGDHFFLRVNEGNRFKITVDASDTMRSLARKVSNILLTKGTAEVSRTGGDGIRITAKEGTTIELIAGSDGFDALEGLGLSPVTLDARKKTAATEQNTRSFALGLDASANLQDKLKSGTLKYQLGSAIETIKMAYMTITGTTLNGTTAVNKQAANAYNSLLNSI